MNMTQDCSTIGFPSGLCALSLTASAVLVGAGALIVTSVLTERDVHALTGAGLAIGLVWLLSLLSLVPITLFVPHGPAAAARAYLATSGVRMLLAIILAVAGIVVFGLPRVVVLLSIVAVYLPLMAIEVAFLCAVMGKFGKLPRSTDRASEFVA